MDDQLKCSGLQRQLVRAADGRSARGGVLMRAQRLRLTLRPLDMKRFIGVSQLAAFLLYFPLVQVTRVFLTKDTTVVQVSWIK